MDPNTPTLASSPPRTSIRSSRIDSKIELTNDVFLEVTESATPHELERGSIAISDMGLVMKSDSEITSPSTFQGLRKLMVDTWLIYSGDVRRLMGSFIPALLIIGLILIPPMYSWFNVIANWAPYDNTFRLKVGVANADVGATLNEIFPGIPELGIVVPDTYVNVGQTVLESLKHNSAVNWQFVNPLEAYEEVEKGHYYASLVIPEDFTSKLGSVLSSDIQRPHLNYIVNEKKNAIAVKITDKVASSVQQTVNENFLGVVGKVVADLINEIEEAIGGIIGLGGENEEDGELSPLLSLTSSSPFANAIFGSPSVSQNSLMTVSEAEMTLLMALKAIDSDKFSDFLSHPADLETIKLFPIDTYGSAMSPFYSILAIWVGALLMTSLLTVNVEEKRAVGFGLSATYFGRLGTFITIGAIQSFCVSLGNLYIIGVHAKHEFSYFIVCLWASVVFVNLIFAMVAAFGSVGQGALVILMVVQVAGSGGTFPVDVTPAFFRGVYHILPFTFFINALRETVGGKFGRYMWAQMGYGTIYIVISLLVGLVLRPATISIKCYIHHKFSETGIISH